MIMVILQQIIEADAEREREIERKRERGRVGHER